MPRMLLLGCLLGSAILLSAQTSTFIHVDQFGYWPNAEKVAVLSDPQVGFNASDAYTPANQPALKSYLEFNDGYPLSSWEITEPSISYQAAYLRLLAHFVDAQGPVNSTRTPASTPTAVDVFPNPAQNSIRIDLPEGNYTLQILDTTGKLVTQYKYTAGTLLDIQQLPRGSYLLNLQHLESEQRYQAKLVK